MYCKFCNQEKDEYEFNNYNKVRCIKCLSKYDRQKTKEKRKNEKITKDSFVYFVHAPEVNRIKIGFTKQKIEKRIKQMCGQSPCSLVLIGYINGGVYMENELQEKFSVYNHHNEWFDYSDELKKWVSENCLYFAK